MPPRPLRASELGSYLYCARAWWYQRQGVESANQAEMNTGTELHRQHGRAVLRATLLQVGGVVALLTALALLAAYFTMRLF